MTTAHIHKTIGDYTYEYNESQVHLDEKHGIIGCLACSSSSSSSRRLCCFVEL